METKIMRKYLVTQQSLEVFSAIFLPITKRISISIKKNLNKFLAACGYEAVTNRA